MNWKPPAPNITCPRCARTIDAGPLYTPGYFSDKKRDVLCPGCFRVFYVKIAVEAQYQIEEEQ